MDHRSSSTIAHGAGPAGKAGELFTEARSIQVVAASFAATPDPQLRGVLVFLVRHQHEFIRCWSRPSTTARTGC
jgi:hypothetical protein